MNKYMVYCCAGTGGLFLTSVIANFLGRTVKPNFSSTGHSHDQGYGNWKGADRVVNFIGDYWSNLRRGYPIFNAHYGPIRDFKKSQKNLKVISIKMYPDDYYDVTRLFVCKAWPDILTEQEYANQKGANWPDYSTNIIAESEIVRTDLINHLLLKITDWDKNYDREVVDYNIDFKTVMGLDNASLADTVSDILQKPVTDEIQKLINEYQQLNKRLYFNN